MPVVSIAPCMKFGVMEATPTPRPICVGFTDELPTDWLTRSAKATLLALKATVLMFARLLPMTASFCAFALRPDRLAEKDPAIYTPSLVAGEADEVTPCMRLRI